MNIFYNWLDVDFSYPWGGKIFTFKAGETYNQVITSVDGSLLLLEKNIIEHFAKHLADFAMNHFKDDPRAEQIKITYIERAKVAPVAVAVAPLETVEESEPVEAETKKPKATRKPKAKVEELTTEETPSNDEFVGV